ncbi:MAG: phenylacetate--CoA ligase family protein [Acidobacteriaceae bacterium]
MTEPSQSVSFPFLPAPSAFFVRNVVHPVWTRARYPAYARYRREFERNQFLDPDELRQLQMKRLRQQLLYAYRYVPFYSLRMVEAGVTPLDIQTHEDLRLLPMLTRRDIQDHQDLLVSCNVPANKRVGAQAEGPTGSPLQIYVDKERVDSRMASTARHDGWAGLRPGDWYAELLWGGRFDVGDKPDANPEWRQKFLYRNLTLHAAAATEESMMQYVEVLRQYRPKFLLADAQSAVLFAEFCQKYAIQDVRFESMIVSAEMLPPGKRAVLESTFGGKVFHRYGCREVGVIASECEFHSGLHVNADALLVEVEPHPTLPTGMGRILITDLLNRSMPLLRYEICDLAAIDDSMQCPCGRSLPLIGSMQGRTSDFLRAPSGRVATGPSLALPTSNMGDVRQARVVQPDPQNATLKVVAGRGHSADTKHELRRRMDPASNQRPA